MLKRAASFLPEQHVFLYVRLIVWGRESIICEKEQWEVKRIQAREVIYSVLHFEFGSVDQGLM